MNQSKKREILHGCKLKYSLLNHAITIIKRIVLKMTSEEYLFSNKLRGVYIIQQVEAIAHIYSGGTL